MSMSAPQAPAIIPPAMAAPAPPPTFGMSPVGQKRQQKNPAATFLGSMMVPGPASGNFGGKTLIGA